MIPMINCPFCEQPLLNAFYNEIIKKTCVKCFYNFGCLIENDNILYCNFNLYDVQLKCTYYARSNILLIAHPNQSIKIDSFKLDLSNINKLRNQIKLCVALS